MRRITFALHREVALQGVSIYGLKQTYELALIIRQER